MFEPAKQIAAVSANPVHLGEHHVTLGATEFLSEHVGDEAVKAKLDELPPPANFEVGDPHHARNYDHRWPRLSVAAPDEDAFELLAFELVGDCTVLAHFISLANSASLATVFI